MAYANDPATDRRISRLSLISSAANLFAGKTTDPTVILNAAIDWEGWVYDQPPASATNGVTPAPAAPAMPTCAECGEALTPVHFKTGNTWPVEMLASRSQDKFGKVLCKRDYFGKKTVGA